MKREEKLSIIWSLSVLFVCLYTPNYFPNYSYKYYRKPFGGARGSITSSSSFILIEHHKFNAFPTKSKKKKVQLELKAPKIIISSRY